MYITPFLALLGICAAIPSSNVSAPCTSPAPTPTCTSTMTEFYYAPKCAITVYKTTATAYTDCNGCALATTSRPQYMGRPPRPVCRGEYGILTSESTTITACAPSTTAAQMCTKTITDRVTLRCAAQTVYRTTDTVSTECGNCVLQTQTALHYWPEVCPAHYPDVATLDATTLTVCANSSKTSSPAVTGV